MKNHLERKPFRAITYCQIDKKNAIFKINDWVVVKYDDDEYRGMITNVVENDVEVNVMIETRCGRFKWPDREDKILYAIENVFRKSSPPIPADNRYFHFCD